MGASKYNAIYMVILAILPQGGIDVLVVQQPQHWNAHCKFLVWERSEAISQNDDAGGKGVLHMMKSIFTV